MSAKESSDPVIRLPKGGGALHGKGDAMSQEAMVSVKDLTQTPANPAATVTKEQADQSNPAVQFLKHPEEELASLLHNPRLVNLGSKERDLRDLRTDIIILQQRADRQLRKESCEGDQVLRLLANAEECLLARDATHGRLIFKEAERIFHRYNQTKNRIHYLIGALLGIVIAAPLGFLLSKLAAPIIDIDLRAVHFLIFVFAGIGSLTSVLTRVSSIDLREETSKFSVYISGFSRPLIATVLAVVVNVIVNGRIVEIAIGAPGNGKGAGCLVISFLCGFSERFAQDIIARVPFASEQNTAQPVKSERSMPPRLESDQVLVQT